MKILCEKFEENNPKVQGEVLWFLSNICVVDNHYLLQQVIETGILSKALKIIPTGDEENKIEASYCLYNILEKGSYEQVFRISEEINIESLIENLSTFYSMELIKISLLCLCKLTQRALAFAVEYGTERIDGNLNPVIKKITSSQKYYLIEELLKHPNPEIEENARVLIDELITPTLDKFDKRMGE